jgi:Spy/CpxP family protein refolding chaperone
VTPQKPAKTHWVWLTCVAALVAATTWTGAILTATSPALTSQATQTPQRPAATPQSPAQSAQGRGADANRQSFTPFSSFEWWNDADIKKEIGLSEDKAKKIAEFYEGRNRQMQPWIDDWRKERALLDKMTQERVSDDTSYGIQVWRVEQLNAKLRETRAMMIYRMYMQLSPEQYKKLRELLDRRSNGRGGRGGPGPR